MSIENKLAYRHWLANSFEWETLRLIALVKSEFQCWICRTKGQSHDVHHRWYRAKWNDTQQDDLVVLCRKCHSRVHQLTKPGRVLPGESHKPERAKFRKAAQKIRVELGLKGTTPNCAICQVSPKVKAVSGDFGAFWLCADCVSVWDAVMARDNHPRAYFAYAYKKKQLHKQLQAVKAVQ